jgi:type I restriction enzyme S subunit
MKVIEKYKQTEVGLIPSDWEVKYVGEAFEICNHLRLPISEDVRGKMQGDYPYYGPTKIQDYIDEFRVEGEYALIGEDGDHFLKWNEISMTQITSGKFNVNNHAHLVKGKNNISTTKWFYYFFKNRDLTNHLTRQGAGRFKLSKSTLLKIPCAIPPTLSEQTAIATALSDADALISSLEKLISKKRNIKQGAMQKLLEPKEGWEAKRLGEVLTFGSGRDYKYLDNGEIPVYGTGGVMTYVNDFLYEGESVGIGRKGTIDKPIFLKGKFWTVDTLFYTHQFLKANPKFIYYRFCLIKWKEYNEASGVPSLNKNTLENIEISIPSFEEQTRIATILSDMDAEINALESKLEKYKKVKLGMMQNLLTGKKRLV